MNAAVLEYTGSDFIYISLLAYYKCVDICRSLERIRPQFPDRSVYGKIVDAAVLKCAFANFCYAGAFFYNDFQHISRVFKGIVTDEEIRTRKRNIFYGRIIKGPVFSHGLTYLSLLDISILFYHIFLFLATGSFHRLLRLVSSLFDD